MLLKKILFPLILVIGTLTACVQPPPYEKLPQNPRQVKGPSTQAPSSPSQKRLALLIGNSNYVGVNFLTNPVNDAKALAKVLKEQLNFEVIEKLNLNRGEMKDAITQFGQQLGRNQGVGLFYFSGHGIQYEGKNHLLPIGAKNSLQSVVDLKEGTETVTLNYVLEHMKLAENEVNILILDACRNTPPFVKSWYKGDMIDPGMAKQSNPPSGTLIAYAAASGKVAESGEGQNNSPYVKSLMKWLPTPNLSITDALTQVRKDVKQATYQQQEPEYSAALDDIFYLKVKMDTQPTQASLLPPENRFVAGKVFRDRLPDGSQGPKMVMIPGGTFRMGDIQGGGRSNEKPVHTVSVDRFAMGQHEITFAEYDKFAKATGQTLPDDNNWGRGNRPVINVSWLDVTAYAEWLSQQTGQDYRLPTEAEWEYAARAGRKTKYWWGNTASHEYANYGADECCNGLAKGKDRWKYTSPVGAFAANPFGLYDTAGNVWEWTCSEYEQSYDGKEKSCLSKNDSNDGSLFVLRGGSWILDAVWVRSAIRIGYRRTDRNWNFGARLARIL